VEPVTDIRDAVAAWHDDPEDDRPLHEYLEMTWEQYARWAEVGELPDGSPFTDAGSNEAEEHHFDEGSVLNPVTGQPYGPGPLWAGTEPMDYPDPRCVCGELWGEDNTCSAAQSSPTSTIQEEQ
jgi:hypothetical protein